MTDDYLEKCKAGKSDAEHTEKNALLIEQGGVLSGNPIDGLLMGSVAMTSRNVQEQITENACNMADNYAQLAKLTAGLAK